MPIYVNIKSGEPYDVYCGRANKTYSLAESKWANPFVIGRDGSRAEVIQKYEQMILNNPKLMADIGELKNMTLSCWCWPLDCHCRILIQLANETGIS